MQREIAFRPQGDHASPKDLFGLYDLGLVYESKWVTVMTAEHSATSHS